MRLSAIELLDKLQQSYGIRMLDVFKETGSLFPSLLEMYARYPYNDIALRQVTNIIAHALDSELAKTMKKSPIHQVSRERPGMLQRTSRELDLEPIKSLEDEMREAEEAANG